MRMQAVAHRNAGRKKARHRSLSSRAEYHADLHIDPNWPELPRSINAHNQAIAANSNATPVTSMNRESTCFLRILLLPLPLTEPLAPDERRRMVTALLRQNTACEL